MAIRLIDTDKLHLTSFMGSEIPKYAILSHTWERDGEISFQEMETISENPDHAKKSGYAKIAMVCEKARTNGIGYVWVDTCCIDKEQFRAKRGDQFHVSMVSEGRRLLLSSPTLTQTLPLMNLLYRNVGGSQGAGACKNSSRRGKWSSSMSTRIALARRQTWHS